MLGAIRNYLSGLDYAKDYLALWITSSLLFVGVCMLPAIIYLLYYGEIDKRIKSAVRGPRSRDLEPEEREDLNRRNGRRKRKKFLVSRRLLLFHGPFLIGLLVAGTLVAFTLTRLLASS